MKHLVLKTTIIFCATVFLLQAARAADWRFKRAIIIENTGEEVANAVVEIQLEANNFDYSNARPHGEDIRFAADKNLKGDGLCYWIEQWNDSGASKIWLKIPRLKANKKLKLNMFYGNSNAKAVSDGNTTFLFFDDFKSGDFTKKWTNVSIGQVAEQDGLLKLKETDGQDGIITANNFNLKGKMIVRALYQRGNADEHWTRAGIGGWNYFLCFGDHTDFAGTGTNYIMIYDGNSLSSLKTAPLIKAANKVITNKWRPVAFWYDGQSLKGMQDDITVAWPAADAASKLSLRTLDNDAWDMFAHITVSPFTGNKQTVIIGKTTVNR